MSKFVYLNVNDSHMEEEDCVCRAIKLATGLPYHTVEMLLEMSAVYFGCDALNCDCYSRLLEEVFEFPVKKARPYETVEDIIDKYPNNTLLIRIDGHLTCAIDGYIYDLWNSDYRKVTKYWIVR